MADQAISKIEAEGDQGVDKRLFFLLNMGQHKLYKHIDQRCEKETGVPVAQVAALLFLGKQDGCLLKDLGKALHLNNSAMTGLSNRLEANGLANKKPCAEDGRAFRLHITQKGRKALEASFPLMAEMNEQLQAEFSDDELDVVARFLNHLIERF